MLNCKSVLIFVLFAVMALFAEPVNCRIQSVVWTGEHSEFDEAEMAKVLGEPCDVWQAVAAKLTRYYEDQGFVAAQISGTLSRMDSGAVTENLGYESAALTVRTHRGAGYVWAPAENLVPTGTKPEVFRRLSGIEEGAPVSLTDLERAERKLARVGYFEKKAPVKLFRDPARNRLVPAFSMESATVSEAEALLTYESEDNVWEGMLNVNLYNILGTARDLQMEGFTGEDSRHLHGRYKEPWIFGSAWNVVLRGSFDEETIADESAVDDDEHVEREILGEIGITRDIGFDFAIGVYFGITEDDKRSTFEMSYISLDRFALPRDGWKVEASATWKMDRPDSLDNILATSARVARYMPLYGNFITRFSGAAGGIFHTDAAYRRTDMFALGGMDSFKGMAYQQLRSRTYGFSEFALLWQDGYDLSIEAFYQPGLYRRALPEQGWAREQDYGIGFTQYRKNWSINLYYALRNGCDYLEGILGFGVRTLF